MIYLKLTLRIAINNSNGMCIPIILQNSQIRMHSIHICSKIWRLIPPIQRPRDVLTEVMPERPLLILSQSIDMGTSWFPAQGQVLIREYKLAGRAVEKYSSGLFPNNLKGKQRVVLELDLVKWIGISSGGGLDLDGNFVAIMGPIVDSHS